jgi:hypothetical protein
MSLNRGPNQVHSTIQQAFGVIMKKPFIIAMLVASSALVAAPAFASGYGPAPFYRPDVANSASQPGTQSMAAKDGQAMIAIESRNAGGAEEQGMSESGNRADAERIQSLYRGM